ncbi:unnamed protein product [Amoebophrya sp. A120]|nr:unnamed protein product [Amoebophrya sp. A120]|eukprot:GSA120T00006658001.1
MMNHKKRTQHDTIESFSASSAGDPIVDASPNDDGFLGFDALRGRAGDVPANAPTSHVSASQDIWARHGVYQGLLRFQADHARRRQARERDKLDGKVFLPPRGASLKRPAADELFLEVDGGAEQIRPDRGPRMHGSASAFPSSEKHGAPPGTSSASAAAATTGPGDQHDPAHQELVLLEIFRQAKLDRSRDWRLTFDELNANVFGPPQTVAAIHEYEELGSLLLCQFSFESGWMLVPRDHPQYEALFRLHVELNGAPITARSACRTTPAGVVGQELHLQRPDNIRGPAGEKNDREVDQDGNRGHLLQERADERRREIVLQVSEARIGSEKLYIPHALQFCAGTDQADE